MVVTDGHFCSLLVRIMHNLAFFLFFFDFSNVQCLGTTILCQLAKCFLILGSWRLRSLRLGFSIRPGFMMAQQSAGCQDYFHAAICWPVGNFRTRESTSTPCSLIPHPTPAGFPLSGHVPILFTCRIKGIPFRLVFTPEFFVSFYCDLILFSVCHTFFFCLAIYTL